MSEAKLAKDIADAHRRHKNRIEKIARAEQFAPVPFSERPVAKSVTRNAAALTLRRQGKTFREVGEAFGVSAGRAAQMCLKAEHIERQSKQQANGLSTRAKSVLVNEGLGFRDGDDYDISPKMVSSNLTKRSLAKLVNCGPTTANEILVWLDGHGYQLRNG